MDVLRVKNVGRLLKTAYAADAVKNRRNALVNEVMASSKLFGRPFLFLLTGERMDKYVCTVCGYIYDPEKGDPDSGVEPGTPFENLPDDWVCPMCGAAKDMFEKEV